jgi:alpha-1,6-mannosyltransferase
LHPVCVHFYSSTQLWQRVTGVRLIDVNNFYSPTGGGVRTYHERRREYYRKRDDVTYALVVPSSREARVVDGNTVTYEVPAIPIGAGYRLVVSPDRLRRVFDDFAPDLVEVGSAYVLPLIVPRALGERRPALVGFYHADYPDTSIAPAASALPSVLGDPLLRAARRHAGWVYRSMDAVCAASEHVLRKLSGFGVRRLFRTPLGLDSALFDPRRRSATAIPGCGDDQRPVVLYLARLAPEKGIDVLLRGWDAIAARTNARLVIGGHGPSQARVDAFCAARPDVVRLPYLDRRESVAATMASADVFLSLGAHETFSLTTVEALASGCAVVAPDAGGAGELVRREHGGRTFAPGVVDAFVQAVLTAVEGRSHVDQLRVAASVRRAYDWDARLDVMTRVYTRVLDAKRANNLDSLSAPDGLWWDSP